MNNNPYVLCQQLGKLCLEHNVSIALAESCTGGLLSTWLTEASGASQWFCGSACVYSNDAKVGVLGVNKDVISRYGAVSEEVAREMAMGAQTRYASVLTLSITGIAGPFGGSSEKPVGMVCFGLYDARNKKCFTNTDRKSVV